MTYNRTQVGASNSKRLTLDFFLKVRKRPTKKVLEKRIDIAVRTIILLWFSWKFWRALSDDDCTCSVTNIQNPFFFFYLENGETDGKFVVQKICVLFCYAQIRPELPFVLTNIQIVLLPDTHRKTRDVNPCSILTKLGCADKFCWNTPIQISGGLSLHTKERTGRF
jgi:hypothetical protein